MNCVPTWSCSPAAPTGDTKKVTEIAELVAPAKPRPRFGKAYELPIIFAGNVKAQPEMNRVFGNDGFDLKITDNLRPSLEQENLGLPAT